MNATANDDYGEVTAPGTIRFRRILPGPIERIWAYITESDKRGRWFASGEWQLMPGGKAPLDFRHADLTPHEEIVPDRFKEFENGASYECKVGRCEPPHLISILWPEDWGDTEVIFELAELDDGRVQLTLTHSRLTAEGMKSAGSGWHTHLRILADRLNGREPGPFWSEILEREEEYARRLSRR